MQIVTFAGNLAKTVALLQRASPVAFYTVAIANVIVGLVPGALVYLGAQLIARLTSGATASAVMALVIAYVVLSGFQDSLTAISGFVLDTLQDAARMAVKRDVNHAVSTFADLSIHEETELRETAVLAASTGNSLADLVAHLYYVSLGAMMLVPVALLTANIAWWIPCLMLLGVVPMVRMRSRAERASWSVQENYAATFNELRVLERILLQPEFAKDLRMYHMQDRLLQVWSGLYVAYLQAVKRVRLRNALKLMGTSMFAAACVTIPLYAVIDGYSSGKLGVAALAVFFGALLQLKDGLSAIVFNFGFLVGTSYSIQPYRKLLARYAAQGARRQPSQHAAATYLHLDRVGFQYRNACAPALREIDLTVRHGETIAIVGDNGAGKTSLLKLLCGFYKPSCGVIQWPMIGRDAKVVGVFQDFARFPLTTLESMATDNISDASECLHAVGLDFLQAKLDTPLTTELVGGTDISGGQWQRLAIARAMVHAQSADLLVFDEPTSALDPESESSVMQLILNLARDKTTFIASHRLALTRFVDRIVVLDKGTIIEEGTHDYLIELGGKYARMFHSQARFYQ